MSIFPASVTQLLASSALKLFSGDLHHLSLRQLPVPLLYRFHHSLGQGLKSLARYTVLLQRRRRSGIATFTNTLHNRNLSQQRHIQLLRQALATSFTKNEIFV